VGDTIHDLFLYSPRRDRIVRLSDYVTDVESRRASRVFWLISGAEWCSVTRITVQEAYALWLELRDRGVELLLSLNQDRDYGVTAEAIVAGAQRWDRDVLGDSLEDPDFLGVLADTSRLLDAYYTIAATPLNLIVGPDFTLHYAVVGWEGTEAMRATLEAIIEAEL